MKTKIEKYVNNVSTKLELITPDKAKEILDNTDFKNRDLKQNKISEMIYEMKNDEWVLTHQGISISDNGNLIDGQNRLHAIIGSGRSIYLNVSRGFPEGSFYQIDKGLKRSTADNFNVAKIKNHKSHAAGLKKYFQICDGENQYPSTNRRSHRNDMDLIEFQNENAELLKDVRKMSETLYRATNILSESESYSFMFYTIKEKMWSKSDVFSFMRQVFMLEPPECNAPAILFKRLVEDKNSPVRVKDKMKWAFLIKAFNAWAEREDLKWVRYVPSKEPFPEIKPYTEIKKN